MEPTQRNIFFGVFLVIVIIIASFAGAVLRLGAHHRPVPSNKRVNEKFDEESEITRMADKNAKYERFIKPYFSHDGEDGEVRFTPTVTDVACVTMEDGIANLLDCDGALLDTVSVKDERVVSLPGQETCNSMLVSKQPRNPTDADIKLLNGMYRLTKACIDIPAEDVDTNGDTVVIEINSTDPSATFIALNRPTFLATDNSHLYYFDYESDIDIRTFRGMNADAVMNADDAPSTVSFSLKKVDDTTLLGDSGTKRNLETIYSDNTDESPLHATMFYLRYVGPMEIGTIRLRFDEQKAVSLVFPMTTRLLEKTSDWFNSQGYATPSFKIKGSGNDDGSTTVNLRSNGNTVSSIKVHNRGYLVVTYCKNIVIMCFMSRDRIHVIRTNDVSELTVTDPVLFQIAVDSAGARVPAIAHPANTFSIVNLYDLYTRMVTFS